MFSFNYSAASVGPVNMSTWSYDLLVLALFTCASVVVVAVSGVSATDSQVY